MVFTLPFFWMSFFNFNPHPRICSMISEREEGREKKRDGDVNEKHQLVASHMCPDQGSSCNLGMCPCLGIEPAIFCCMGWQSNQTSHPARPGYLFFDTKSINDVLIKAWNSPWSPPRVSFFIDDLSMDLWVWQTLAWLFRWPLEEFLLWIFSKHDSSHRPWWLTLMTQHGPIM